MTTSWQSNIITPYDNNFTPHCNTTISQKNKRHKKQKTLFGRNKKITATRLRPETRETATWLLFQGKEVIPTRARRLFLLVQKLLVVLTSGKNDFCPCKNASYRVSMSNSLNKNVYSLLNPINVSISYLLMIAMRSW